MNLKKKSAESNKILTKWRKKNSSIVYSIEFSECIWEEFQEKGKSNVYLTKWRKKNSSIFHEKYEFFTKYWKQKVNWIGIFWAKSVKVKWEIY